MHTWSHDSRSPCPPAIGCAARRDWLLGACFQNRPDGARPIASCTSSGAGQIGATELATTNGNAWGLLNAATQHIDHEAGRSADARDKSAWFGHGEAVKRRLLARLLELRGAAAG